MPKGYTSITVGGTPTDAKAREKSPEVVILVIKKALFQKTCFKVAPLLVHASPVRQPGLASLSFAIPGYKSVALRAIANQSAQ